MFGDQVCVSHFLPPSPCSNLLLFYKLHNFMVVLFCKKDNFTVIIIYKLDTYTVLIIHKVDNFTVLSSQKYSAQKEGIQLYSAQ